jgi:NADH dehydrogenase/NADH:ubiquinone oxidoreductase subunit G
MFDGTIGALVEITIEGGRYPVPEGWDLLRCFQYLNFKIPYETFCWNQRCESCRAIVKEAASGEEKSVLCCKTPAAAGIEILKLPSGILP